MFPRSAAALGALASCAWLVAAGCADPAERLQRHLERAEAYTEEDRIQEAILELRNAQALDPQSAEVNARMAELLLRSGNRPMAAYHYGEAWRLDPARISAVRRQARLLRAIQPARARQVIEEALALHPEHAGLHRSLSQLALQRGDPDEGLRAARRAVELAPGAAPSWLQLGLAQRAQADAAEGAAERLRASESALESFARAEARSGGHARVRIETARLLAELPGREDEATEAFRAAIALSAERERPARRGAAALAFERFARQRGDLALAREALREQVVAEPARLDAWTRLAAVTAALEGAAAERRVLDELLSSWPGSPAVRVGVAAHLAASGRAEQALTGLEEALAAGLDHPLIWEQLVRTELALGRGGSARARVEALGERHPDDPVAQRAAARLAAAEGRLDAALATLDVLEQTPEDPETGLLRAQIEFERGDLAAARAALSEVLALGFTEAGARLDAALHARAREWSEALAVLDELESRGYPPGDAERLIRAQAHYERGEDAAGRRALAPLLEAETPPTEAVLEFVRREGADDPDRARARLEAALAREPGHFELLEALTRLDRRSDPAAALRRLDAALALDRADPRTLLLRAELHAEAGRLARAEADAMRALEAAPQLPWAVEVAHVVLQAQGRDAEVRRALEEAESAGALHAGARVLLARLHLAAGDADAARAAYERVIRDTPAVAGPARNDLAFLLASRGQELERAQELALEAQRALPANASVSDTLGYVLLRRGHADAAADQFRRAIRQAGPEHRSLPVFHYHLGLAADALGRPQGAVRQFERALALDPHFRGAADARARLARLATDAGAD